MSDQNYITLGKAVIQTELEAIGQLEQRIGAEFAKACELCFNCSGRIIVTGMGKSGHIARKIAATFASTGTPAFFVHPSEASHGDMGMITQADVVLALSNSGNTEEVVALLPYLKQFGIKLITMTGNPDSTLGKAADAILDTSVTKEACPLNLAPTSSTTVTLVLGDALAISLLEQRGFSKEDFATFHPGGNIGRRLLLKVSDVMRDQQHTPMVTADCTLDQALIESSKANVGLTTVIDAQGKLLGVFSDGDLRRAIEKNVDLYQTTVGEVIGKAPSSVTAESLAAEAYHLMQEKRISCLVVVDAEQKVTGVVQMHDLMLAGMK